MNRSWNDDNNWSDRCCGKSPWKIASEQEGLQLHAGKRGEKPNNYDNNGEWLLKGTRCIINYNQCETRSHACGCIYSDTHAGTHTHTPLLTCLALPCSQVASYLLPLGKWSTPLPWNMPSFISPSYLVSVGKVYFPFPSILRERRDGHTVLETNSMTLFIWVSISCFL